MTYRPNQRRPKWFKKPQLDSLSRFWQQWPQRGRGFRNWLKGRWPASGKGASSRLAGQAMPPGWGPVVPDRSNVSGRSLRMLWQRFRPVSRRQRVGLAAGAGGLLLVSLVGIALLCSHMPQIASGTPIAGGTSGTPATSATTATSTVPLTITFTCASGSIRQTGEVCVHTQANASLNLTVRYCGGSRARGQDFHDNGSADSNGDYTWQFAVHTKCAGTATATVDAKLAGQTVTQSTTFTIKR